jgi:hypothetical protein
MIMLTMTSIVAFTKALRWVREGGLVWGRAKSGICLGASMTADLGAAPWSDDGCWKGAFFWGGRRERHVLSIQQGLSRMV